LLATFGEERTRWGAPTVRELGIDVVSNSPYGLVGPRGMDPAVVRLLHDVFKKASEDPENVKVLKSLDQPIWYKSSADFSAWAAQTWVHERAFLEKLGLVKK
jgi:tripartite-type tricarboxylate transporter receptor subunit TctC